MHVLVVQVCSVDCGHILIMEHIYNSNSPFFLDLKKQIYHFLIVFLLGIGSCIEHNRAAEGFLYIRNNGFDCSCNCGVVKVSRVCAVSDFSHWFSCGCIVGGQLNYKQIRSLIFADQLHSSNIGVFLLVYQCGSADGVFFANSSRMVVLDGIYHGIMSPGLCTVCYRGTKPDNIKPCKRIGWVCFRNCFHCVIVSGWHLTSGRCQKNISYIWENHSFQGRSLASKCTGNLDGVSCF